MLRAFDSLVEVVARLPVAGIQSQGLPIHGDGAFLVTLRQKSAAKVVAGDWVAGMTPEDLPELLCRLGESSQLVEGGTEIASGLFFLTVAEGFTVLNDRLLEAPLVQVDRPEAIAGLDIAGTDPKDLLQEGDGIIESPLIDEGERELVVRHFIWAGAGYGMGPEAFVPTPERDLPPS